LLVDGTVGGTIEGGDIGAIFKQLLADADRMEYAGVWSTEVARDPFLPVLLAAEHTPRLAIGTAIAGRTRAAAGVARSALAGDQGSQGFESRRP
jgi:alkanesulfonate monooxygenase SsuD/methylene tetrahydromethanopterin reductase-like flavin-dependent oxidoreductase (luciferase family)